MLLLNGGSFASGRSGFLDRDPVRPEPTAKIFVKVEFPGIPSTLLAQLDTGAAFSMIRPELADVLGVLDGSGAETVVSTRIGRIRGRLERVPLTLVADQGSSMEIEATFLVSQEWTGGTFLGYAGLLQHIRIALDPSINLFYFGRTG